MLVQELAALLGIAAAISIGAASPGPSFVMVARTAVSLSRADALFAALGMGVGGLIFACLALVGLTGLLTAVPSLYLFLKITGGLYLAYLGFRIWRGANDPLPHGSVPLPSAHSLRRSFAFALTTQLSNPKAGVIYASVFAAFLPAVPSVSFSISTVAIVFAIETGWYSLVAVLLSSQGPRAIYLRSKRWIDRAAGGVMFALGIKLLATSRS